VRAAAELVSQLNYCLHAHDAVNAYKAQGTGMVKKLLNAISEEVIKSSH